MLILNFLKCFLFVVLRVYFLISYDEFIDERCLMGECYLFVDLWYVVKCYGYCNLYLWMKVVI